MLFIMSEQTPPSFGRIILGFFAANAAGAAVIVGWLVQWLLNPGGIVRDTVYAIPLAFADMLVLAWFISSLMSIVPFLIAFWLGRRMGWWRLSYALASGAVIAECILHSSGRVTLDDPLTSELGLNTLVIAAGLTGGAVFWLIIRPRRAAGPP